MARHHSEQNIRDEVVILGKTSTSQDGTIVSGGGYLPVTQQVTATARRSPSLSRIRPHNTANGGLCYTLNTRYEFAAISDYTHAKHCKTCVMYIYET